MASQPEASVLPALPVDINEFIPHITSQPKTPMTELLKPYKAFDGRIRELFSQEPQHPAIADPYVNVVPVFAGHEADVKIRARDMSVETEESKGRYIMALDDKDRKADGSSGVVHSLTEFQHNFNIFTELSLADMDWDNVVVAGSAAVTSLLPVAEKYRGSKRSLRQYYHEVLAPASDVDLFLYGLTEEQAKEKIKQIETKVRDAVLQETTTVRTKNAITIVSQYPTRHVQIVLRIYRSVSEILTGFDVDCSCVAYDGKQVYAAPRAISSFITQVNHVDLSRRSPSYESRLSKYSHRGFEVYWPELDRQRIDPTIFERSFQRTVGLARLLVLEKLPKAADREAYLNKRRQERGRPELNQYRRFGHGLRGDIKNEHEDEVAEWDCGQDDVSDYHTFTIPYGLQYNAKKIQKLLYTKDLLLNAEWNKPKAREVHLHRHPAFFGYAEDVFHDCCGYCPKPSTPEEEQVAEEEGKVYVSGDISFLQDDPGRQSIGSFNPITDKDWTEMAYVGNTARLCQAIVDGDLEHVEDWLKAEGVDPNQRDYTGRTPLHLAVSSSTPEVVCCLIQHGARLVSRLADGRTAMHLAAIRGDLRIVKMIMEKSKANEAEEEAKEIRRKEARAALKSSRESVGDDEPSNLSEQLEQSAGSEEDLELLDDEDESEDGVHSVTTSSFVKIESTKGDNQGGTLPDDDDLDEPDFYDVNVVAWDTPCSPLHLAIVNGHIEIVKELCQTFGADVLLPVKLLSSYDRSPRAAILTLVLALTLPMDKASVMAQTLIDLGATSSQADLNQITAFHYYVNHGSEAACVLLEYDGAAAKAALKHTAVSGSPWSSTMTSPLVTAIENHDSITAIKLLDVGALPEIEFVSWIKSVKRSFEGQRQFNDPDDNMKLFKKSVEQPIVIAIEREVPALAIQLLNRGANCNTLTKSSQELLENDYQRRYTTGETVLDVVRKKVVALQGYKSEGQQPGQPPEPLKDDLYYLRNFEKGSYKYWVAFSDLQKAKELYKENLRSYQEQTKKNGSRLGLTQKQKAIQELITRLGDVEEELVRHGAKTFKELYPDIEGPDDNAHSYSYEPPKPVPFNISFSFLVGELTEYTKELFLELFQAAWEGDNDKIKSLTLVSQGMDKDQPPLRIAVQDKTGASPFSIAVVRGHLDTAKVILEIAQAQYVPEEKKGNERFNMIRDDESYSASAESSSELGIYREIIDDTFTIENIGEVFLQVKSDIRPFQMLRWNCPVRRFISGGAASLTPSDPLTSEINIPDSIFCYAIAQDDVNLLTWLIRLGTEFSDHEDSVGSKFLTFNQFELDYALHLGRTRLVGEMLKYSGVGIPLEDLVETSGVELKERPKYYQGLSIHGRKREDWAAAGRNMHSEKTGSKISPLLFAAKTGNIASVEFMLSDTPLRLYSEFAKANRNDKRLRHLSKATGGFDTAISKWFNAGSNLLLHCAVLAPAGERTDELVAYLIKAMPSSLEIKSADGKTPLHWAFACGRLSSARLLLEAGANQSTRDSRSRNLIHSSLETIHGATTSKLKQLNKILALLDDELCQEMFLQRSSSVTSDGATPLHSWIMRNYLDGVSCSGKGWETNGNMLKLLLKYSKGEDLFMINGAGDTPLHTLVAAKSTTAAKILLDFNPDLLYRENATGRTPAEIGQDQHLAKKFAEPPRVVQQYGWQINRENQGIANRAPETFVHSGESNAKDATEVMWDLCNEYMEKYPGKRRLISLNEANEVARRLSEMMKRSEGRLRRRVDGSDGEGDLHGEYEESHDPVQACFPYKVFDCPKVEDENDE